MLVIALFVIALCVYKHTEAGMGTYAQCQTQAQTRCDCRNVRNLSFVREDLQSWNELPAHHLCWKALSGSSTQSFSP